jgi:hypothetical protein
MASPVTARVTATRSFAVEKELSSIVFLGNL